jgi:hypothetical protein
MSSTNYAKNKMQDYAFGSVSYTPPASYFLALSVNGISSSGSNMSEPVGASYARIEIPNSKLYFTNSFSGSLVNLSALTFPESSGSWGVITTIALMDASTSGSVWFYTDLGTPKTVQSNTVVSFSASAIVISQT